MSSNLNSDSLDDIHLQKISVPYEYPVCFTRNVFKSNHNLLVNILDSHHENRRHRAAVYIDSGVADTHPDLKDKIRDYFHDQSDKLELAANPEVVVGGESAKNGWKTVRDIMFTLGNLHLDRQSFVIAIGGGSLLDMIGFASSLIHRGLRLVRLPTTTLAQNDAGVGVKNGMNEHGQKNFVGTFSPPFAVINDFEFLPTLRQRDWIGGVAEAFKVAIIKDSDFFDFLHENAGLLAARDRNKMEQSIKRCAILHLNHIRDNGDPFEFGSARPLDFGHWSAHRLEIESNYQLGHGQCVAIGIALDSCYAQNKGLLSEFELNRVLESLTRCGLPIWSEILGQRKKDGTFRILDGVEQFREHLGGDLNITLPNGIGNKVEVHQISHDLMETSLNFLKEWRMGG